MDYPTCYPYKNEILRIFKIFYILHVIENHEVLESESILPLIYIFE